MFIDRELDALYEKFAAEAYASGALESKTKELIALACSVMADCVPCIEYHHRKAKQAGASDVEVRETLAITMTVAAGSKKAKYEKVVGELGKAD